jgi:hypothetical protein
MSAYIDPAVIEWARDQTNRVGAGPGFSAAGDLPIKGTLGLRVDVGFDRLGVERTVMTSGGRASVSSSLGQMSSTTVTGGIIRHATSATRRNPVCGYVALTGGLYRYAYRGFSKNSGGLSAKVGLRTQTRVSVYGEFGIDAIRNEAKPPVESWLLFNLHVGGGIVRRF